MRLDSAVVAFVPWLGGVLPSGHQSGLSRVGKPCLRAENSARPLTLRRVALGLTQEAVAARLGVHARTIYRLERRPPYSRGDARVKRLRARVVDLYRYLEKGR